MDTHIRPARLWSDYLQCEQVQRAVWPAPDDRDIVPASLLVTAHKNGGILIGAFEGSKMVAFVFGFLGMEGEDERRRLKHCSHMLAVLPDYRARGLGLALKLAQRDAMLRRKISLVTWTYDPLQPVNALLNIHVLGAIARRYIRNAYGEMFDELNMGVASDRFEAEWWIGSPHVAERLAHREELAEEPAPSAWGVVHDERGLPRLAGSGELVADAMSVEIPGDWNGLRFADLGLAAEWRERTRDLFERAFAEGYAAVDAYRWRDNEARPRAAYKIARADFQQL
ncbi:MAG: hypothetical protein ACM3JD_03385 [Rudaea sp.]